MISDTNYLELGHTEQINGTQLPSIQTHFWLTGYKFGGPNFPLGFNNSLEKFTELKKALYFDYSFNIVKGHKLELAKWRNVKQDLLSLWSQDTSCSQHIDA